MFSVGAFSVLSARLSPDEAENENPPRKAGMSIGFFTAQLGFACVKSQGDRVSRWQVPGTVYRAQPARIPFHLPAATPCPQSLVADVFHIALPLEPWMRLNHMKLPLGEVNGQAVAVSCGPVYRACLCLGVMKSSPK